MEARIAMQHILQRHVPVAAFGYCQSLWDKYQFDFVVTRPRRSKFGDFRAQPPLREKITVNGNLNPYNFLITYLHEIAHLEVYRGYKRKQPAHGAAWKKHFQQLLVPVMNESTFPATVLQPLLNYARDPKYSTAADAALMTALRAFDPAFVSNNPQSDLVEVSALAEGDVFKLNQKVFVRGTLRRTRVVCTEKRTQRLYTVAAHALVEKLEK
ncbi:MAG: sprT domain-containing protein [Spirosomaceae bacterium]|nr:sprT domain-containing protein [Spirosomataceae bacterium]